MNNDYLLYTFHIKTAVKMLSTQYLKRVGTCYTC